MTSFPTDRTGEIRPKLAGEYDALADLFLGADDPPLAAQPHANAPALRLVHDEPPSPAACKRAVRIEAMLLGSLPIYASAWVTQFVRAEASRLASPVALVRTLAGEGSVDLFGPLDATAAQARAASFTDALREATTLAEHVIIRTGETSESELASHEQIGSITLLTGIDEPALIAAYRTLKMLAPRWESRATPPTIRIAAMGATDEQGRRAFEKIARAARVFLETPLAYAGSVDRIEPAPSVSIFRGPTSIDTDDVIATLRSPAEQKDTEIPATDPAPAEKAPEPVAPARFEQFDAIPVASHDSHESALATEPLSSRIAGLARVPVSIPKCPGVELAADASGGLHLLTRDDDTSTPTSSLLAAQAWASVNRELLAAACATLLGSPVDATRPATLHLFTDQPKRVRSLLDADIRVHFLGRVELNGAHAWCVAELN